MPEPIPESGTAELLDRITAIAYESTLSRAEILGVLEAAKLRVWFTWQMESEERRDARRG